MKIMYRKRNLLLVFLKMIFNYSSVKYLFLLR